MKLLPLTLLLIPSTLASLFSTSEPTILDDDDLSVPGSNPLKFCEDPVAEGHILNIERVDLEPNPPRAGETLTIKATGNFTKEIIEGAYVNIVVKLRSIPLLRRKQDLCSQMKEVDKECPLEKGETTITKSVDLPSIIPSGVINVEADVFSVANEKITCLRASIQFKKNAAVAEEKKKKADAQKLLPEAGVDL